MTHTPLSTLCTRIRTRAMTASVQRSLSTPPGALTPAPWCQEPPLVRRHHRVWWATHTRGRSTRGQDPGPDHLQSMRSTGTTQWVVSTAPCLPGGEPLLPRPLWSIWSSLRPLQMCPLLCPPGPWASETPHQVTWSPAPPNCPPWQPSPGPGWSCQGPSPCPGGETSSRRQPGGGAAIMTPSRSSCQPQTRVRSNRTRNCSLSQRKR